VLRDFVTLSHLAQIDDLVGGSQKMGERYILPQDKLENKERIPRVARAPARYRRSSFWARSRI